jgi:predicted Rossmann fold nucleotide-binding protein DprA/Smf involved in DNA uptake
VSQFTLAAHLSSKQMAIQLSPKETTLYSHNLSACLGQDAPAQLNFIGQGELSLSGSLALICSARAPAGILLAGHDLAQQWRQERKAIISGFHSPVEQEALEILLREPGRTIYCPARGLPKRLKPGWQSALDAGRLTILSPFPDSVRRATKETAIYRNRFVAALADTVLIAYAHPGSSTEQLAQEVLGWGKPVYTLAHESNAPLQVVGAKIMGE